jgi:hypothetical protein
VNTGKMKASSVLAFFSQRPNRNLSISMRMKTAIFITTLLWSFSCNEPANIQIAQQYLDNTAFRSPLLIDSFKFCIVIPDEGCSACIKKSTHFVVDKIDSLSDHLVVFTGVKDIKMLSMKVGKKFLLRENVLIDSSDILMNPGFSSIYPQVIEIKNGRACRISVLPIP